MEGAPPSRGALLLFPFMTLSVHPFSYPFRSIRDVAAALALKFKPLLSGEEGVDIVPWLAPRGPGEHRGAAWLMAASEVPGDEEEIPLRGNICWPLPMALASSVDGEGIAVFCGEGLTASALFSGGVPLFARCAPLGEGLSAAAAIDGEVRLCREYGLATGAEGLVSSLWTGTSKEDLLEAARGTVSRFPSYLPLNVSRPALEASRARERTTARLKNFFAAAALSGLLFCGAQYSLSFMVRSSMENLTSRGRSLYREISLPGERIVDPLSQARGRVAELKGSGEDKEALVPLLSHLGGAWIDPDGRKGGYPVVEQLRYSDSGAEITGTAPVMEAIQALRSALDDDGFHSSLGDVQQIGGGGLRFSLSLRRTAP